MKVILCRSKSKSGATDYRTRKEADHQDPNMRLVLVTVGDPCELDSDGGWDTHLIRRRSGGSSRTRSEWRGRAAGLTFKFQSLRATVSPGAVITSAKKGINQRDPKIKDEDERDCTRKPSFGRRHPVQ